MKLLVLVLCGPSAFALELPAPLGRRAVAAAAAYISAAALGGLKAACAVEERAALPIFGSGGRIDRVGKPELDLAEQYAANPADLSGLELPLGCKGAENVALIFVGSGGPDRETAEMCAALKAQDEASGLKRCVEVINWKPYFTADTSRLSFVSRDIGFKLGSALASDAPSLRSCHIIGTSAGSFAADAMVCAYVQAREGRSRATVRLSLADPFAAKADAPPNAGRGAQYFGRSADFAEHILNTDDPVPNTDVPLPFCYVYDVTAAAERREFKPPEPTGDFLTDFVLSALGYHNWPLSWLAKHCETTVVKGNVVIPSHEQLPRGQVVRVA
jgi:hypothetical protein